MREAVHSVLGNPDLVALILERLPTPQLGFGTSERKVKYTDRWAASQVNAVFRKAALRLPWEAHWGLHMRYKSAASLRALAILESRNVQAWSLLLGCKYPYVGCKRVEGYEQTNFASAAVLNYARGTERLSVGVSTEIDLLGWLHHALVPVPGGQGSLNLDTPVLACLATLSRLTRLQVLCGRWLDGSWLTHLSHLRYVDLHGYCGRPLACLPALEDLSLVRAAPLGVLEEWGSPRLTALSFDVDILLLNWPSAGRSARWPCAYGTEARGWLKRLQRLELREWPLPTTKTGLRELVPDLTYLKLWRCIQTREALTLLVSQGLPVRLKGLCVRESRQVWPAIFELQDLVSLEVWQDGKPAAGDTAAVVVSGLTRLPHLQHVSLRLPCDSSNETSVKEGFKALGDLLLSRRGCLRLDLSPYGYAW